MSFAALSIQCMNEVNGVLEPWLEPWNVRFNCSQRKLHSESEAESVYAATTVDVNSNSPLTINMHPKHVTSWLSCLSSVQLALKLFTDASPKLADDEFSSIFAVSVKNISGNDVILQRFDKSQSVESFIDSIDVVDFALPASSNDGIVVEFPQVSKIDARQSLVETRDTLSSPFLERQGLRLVYKLHDVIFMSEELPIQLGVSEVILRAQEAPTASDSLTLFWKISMVENVVDIEVQSPIEIRNSSSIPIWASLEQENGKSQGEAFLVYFYEYCD